MPALLYVESGTLFTPAMKWFLEIIYTPVVPSDLDNFNFCFDSMDFYDNIVNFYQFFLKMRGSRNFSGCHLFRVSYDLNRPVYITQPWIIIPLPPRWIFLPPRQNSKKISKYCLILLLLNKYTSFHFHFLIFSPFSLIFS